MKLNFDITFSEYEIVKNILVRHLSQDCKIWVFGSRSKNKTRFNSDLDLALQDIKPLPQTTLIDLKEDFSESSLPYTVDIVDMNNIATDFKQIIEKQAIEFPIEKTTTTPKIRFPEFSGAWGEKKLGEVGSFLKGKNLSKDDIIIDGKYECVRYGELYTVYNEIINTVFSKKNLNPNENIISEYGDVLIPSSGETQIDIAKASCILKNGVILGGDLNILRGAENGAFISYYVNGNLKPKIAILAQGNSVVHLYSSQLKNLKISLPLLPEQQKIADFLTAVDDKIGLLTKEHKLWQVYKKGMMQRIFSQSLRFTDDNGNPYNDWGEKSLGEVCSKKSSNIVANDLENNQGNYIVYGASGVLKKINFYKEEDEYISIVKDGAGVGRVFVCEKQTSVLGTLDIIKNNKLSNLKFLYAILDSINFLKYTIGSTIPHIYFKDYSSEIIPVPSLPEQQKIADFLSAVDEKINLVKQQLDKTKEFKKGLLQKMFV